VRADAAPGASAPPRGPVPAGTPEAEWVTALAGCERVPAPTGHLVVVAPHPDDETLGAGGTLARAVAAGDDPLVVVCSDGEASHPVVGLGERRRAECVEACAALGVGACRVRFLGLPDGHLADHADVVAAQVAAAVRPGTTVLAPWAHDGHPDHEAVARAVAVAVDRCGHADVVVWAYPVWAWHWWRPEDLRLDARHHEHLVAVELDGAARRAKRDAIACHRSQWSDELGAPILPPGVLAHFRRPYEAFLCG